MKTPGEIAELLFRHSCGELSQEEEQELTAWRAMSAENEQVFRDANDPEYIRREIQFIHEAKDRVYKRIMEDSPFADAAPKPIRSGLYKFLRIAAIAVVSLTTLYFIMNIDIGGSPHKAANNGKYNAQFINPEGIAIAVDDMKRGYADGIAAAERKKKKNEEPFFTATSDPQAAADKYNTLRTPTGAQYGLLLPDGTRVWLNGGTSVKYPAHFPFDSPKIAVSGEVYVEITPNKSARTQFHVAVGNMQLSATEGRFDVKVYTADSVIITAIDGNLHLDTDSSQQLLLHPHEQAQLIRGKLHIMKNVDLHKILAWKINAGKQ